MTSLEENKIRIPENIIKKLNKKVGEILVFKTIKGDMLPLIIDTVFQEDADHQNNYSFVTIKNLVKLTQQPSTEAKEICVGCDPEFFLTKNNVIVNAANFFNQYDQIGYDGVLGEFRPTPSKNPKEVVDNLRKLIEVTRNLIKIKENIKLKAGSFKDGYACGFHIHFEIPNFLLKQKYRYVLMVLARVLDYYLAIPAMLYETNYNIYRRLNKVLQYGKAGDFRYNSKTFEYRVIGGVLLKTPESAAYLLNTAQICVQDTLSRLERFTNKYTNLNNIVDTEKAVKEIYPNILDFNIICNILYQNDTNLATKQLKKIQYDIQNMELYHKLGKYSDYFTNESEIIKENNKINDLTYNWLKK